MNKHSVKLDVKQGEDWEKGLVYRVDGVLQNNTGWGAQLIVATHSDPPVLATITEVDSADGVVTFGGANGVIVIWMKEALTEQMENSEYWYDFFIIVGGKRKCLFSGSFTMFPSAG